MSRGRHAIRGAGSDDKAVVTRTARRAKRRRTARRSRLAAIGLGIAAGFGLLGAGAAFGYLLTTDSSNPAVALAAHLSAPTAPTATESGSASVTVGWTLPGGQLTGAGYQVTRTSGPGSPFTVCTVASPTHSCQDHGLGPGATYGYSIVAVLHDWVSPTVVASAKTIAVTTASLPDGVIGVPYSTTLAATGGSGTYTHWALSSGTLPAWAHLNASTGAITGTPGATGTTSGLEFTVADSLGASATSGPLSLTVHQARTSTALVSNHNPAVVGQKVTYTATVSVTPPASGTPPSSDTVTFEDGGSPIACGAGSQAFNGTTATCVVTYKTAKGSPHSISAVFGGDPDYVGSTSPTLWEKVHRCDTDESEGTDHDSPVVGQPVTYTATLSVVAPGGGAPSDSDTVTFMDGGRPVACGAGSQPFNGTTATCRVTYTAAGVTHSVTSTFAGDDDYGGATSAPMVQTVQRAPTATTLSADHNPSVVGEKVTYSATVAVVAPGAGTLSSADSVTFEDGGSAIACGAGSHAFDGTAATCVVAYGSTTGSPHPVTATFDGESDFAPSTSPELSQAVHPASTTTSLTSSVDPSVVGQPVTYDATVSVDSPGSGTPSSADDVIFMDGDDPVACGRASHSFDGKGATCAVTSASTSGSPRSITAVFGGDPDFAASTSSPVSQVVNAASTTTSLTAGPDPAQTSQPVTYDATVAVNAPGSGSPSSSDAVTFKDGGSPISCGSGSHAFDGTTATCVVTYSTAAGSPHSVTASFSGDASFTASTSPAVSQTVISAPAAPTGVSVVENGCTLDLCSVEVGFSAPSDGGSPISSYAASCSSSDGGLAPTPGTGGGSPIQVPPTLGLLYLSQGKTYTCSVTATNSVGTGPPGTSSSFVA